MGGDPARSARPVANSPQSLFSPPRLTSATLAHRCDRLAATVVHLAICVQVARVSAIEQVDSVNIDKQYTRALVLFCLAFAAVPTQAAESCTVIRGRAHLYGGDGGIRIWHVGTHHEYLPDESSGHLVEKWLEAGAEESDRHYASPASMVYLFADFLICPTEPFQEGSVQQAKVKRASHRHYIRVPD